MWLFGRVRGVGSFPPAEQKRPRPRRKAGRPGGGLGAQGVCTGARSQHVTRVSAPPTRRISRAAPITAAAARAMESADPALLVGAPTWRARGSSRISDAGDAHPDAPSVFASDVGGLVGPSLSRSFLLVVLVQCQRVALMARQPEICREKSPGGRRGAAPLCCRKGAPQRCFLGRACACCAAASWGQRWARRRPRAHCPPGPQCQAPSRAGPRQPMEQGRKGAEAGTPASRGLPSPGWCCEGVW